MPFCHVRAAYTENRFVLQALDIFYFLWSIESFNTAHTYTDAPLILRNKAVAALTLGSGHAGWTKTHNQSGTKD